MKTFSISDAIGEAFRTGFGRPVATTAWGLVLLVPALIVLGAAAPMFSELSAAGAFSAGADPEALEAEFSSVWQFQVWMQLSNLVQLLSVLLVTTAIGRAVLSGRRRGDGAMFLRVGVDELHVAVVGLAVGVGAILALIVAILLATGIGFALWRVGEPWRMLSLIGMGAVVAVAFLLLWGRLALMAPASLRYRTFGFESGWKLGRGQTWRLFGLLLAMILVALLLAAVLIVIVLIAALVLGAGVGTLAMDDPEAMAAWAEGLGRQPAWLIVAGVVLLLPLAWLQGFSQVLMTAPYARVVEVLAREPVPVEPISADTGLEPL